jgi:hypothetical protein
MQAVKVPQQRSRYWRSIFVVILVAIVFSLQSCGVHNKHGAATPDRVVEQYLTALAARNESAILRLMPEKSLATDLVKAKIARLGGHKIEDRQINYTKPKPSLWNAKLSGLYVDRFGVKRKFADSIVLEYQSKGELKLYAGHWYLLLSDSSDNS